MSVGRTHLQPLISPNKQQLIYVTVTKIHFFCGSDRLDNTTRKHKNFTIAEKNFVCFITFTEMEFALASFKLIIQVGNG